ncbi:MAG: Mov34/MPN/PAD-1 family protein [Planctomycetes bacterium]|nr:Mov34/MPN/PAD-1 family protein [Planctomycetota bacterium]
MHALRAGARRAAPREFVAALGGHEAGGDVRVTAVVALPNVALDDDAFEVEPTSFLAAEATLRARGAPFVGFAHSHPVGACAPSARDLAQLWPDCVQLITDGEQVRAYRIDRRRRAQPLPCRVAEAPTEVQA